MANRVTNISNFARTVTTASMGSSSLSVSVDSTEAFPAAPYLAVFEPESPDRREVLLFDEPPTSDTMTTSTIDNRYLGGSAAASGITHPAGSTVICGPLGQHVDDLNDRIDAVIEAIAGLEPITVHNELTGRSAEDAHPITAISGLAGALVGIDGQIAGLTEVIGDLPPSAVIQAVQVLEDGMILEHQFPAATPDPGDFEPTDLSVTITPQRADSQLYVAASFAAIIARDSTAASRVASLAIFDDTDAIVPGSLVGVGRAFVGTSGVADLFFHGVALAGVTPAGGTDPRTFDVRAGSENANLVLQLGWNIAWTYSLIRAWEIRT